MHMRAVVAVGLLLFSPVARAVDCKIAIVGSPFSTCWDIANAAGINVDTLQEYNANLDCNLLTPGQKLCVSTGTFPVPNPNPDGTCATHAVVAGDTCLSIANVYGITAANIETWSKPIWRFQGCGLLQIGAKVCISAGLPPPIPVNPNAQCGPETPGNKTCPSNVCCSAWGFCGQTSEFCEAAGGFPCNSNCGTPTLAKCSGSQLTRKIGYFAGWAARRPENCGRFTPANLDLTGYTGVIFAFATIGNDDKISLDSRDMSVLKDLVALKDRWPSLQVTIAVGGWAFSMDDPTKTVFTQMISTFARRTTFINSVKDLISTYRLDGVDIDLEYPAATERAAPVEDTPNLTALMRELRAALGSQIVSIATPAAYWFLRGFEIDNIASSATYVNVMTYDYHGPWDLKVQGEDGTAKAHTSVEDIMDTIRLYTRAKVPFNKLNLGLAWYGRTYEVGSCKGTKCLMAGGGKPGRCTGESGIKSQDEINKEVADNKITRTYDTTTRAYWYNYNDDFISYDDTDSWAYKTQVARDHCFGGTFIWSLDQETPSAPEPPAPIHEVACQHSLDDKTKEACTEMVNDIFDTNQYNLNGTNKCLSAAKALKPFPCHNGCCLYIAQADYQDVTIRAKEVKAAALSILSQCHGVGDARRGLERRAAPLAALFASYWSQVAFVGIATTIFVSIAKALVTIIREWETDDDEERGEYVKQVLTNTTRDYPEFNVVLAHHDHTPSFQSPCYHKHVEFDRPVPHGTYGYEVYLARRGKFLLKGDGGWMNWGYSGSIVSNPENSKDLTFRPPGANYGNVRNVRGKYVVNGETRTTEDIAVSLGSSDGCATSFGWNHEDTAVVRCEDVEF